MYLNCHTTFSLRYGTLRPKELVEQAAAIGLKELVLTDINNTSCAFEFITLCKQKDIKPIVGMEFRNDDHELLYIGIAKNAEGFKALNELFTHCSLAEKELPVAAPLLPHTYIIYPKLIKPIDCFRSNEFLGIRPEHVNKLYAKDVLKYRARLVVWSPITFGKPEDYEVHRLLRAIDKNTLITKLKAKDCAKRTETWQTPTQLIEPYQTYPFIIENTRRLLANCSIEMTPTSKNNRQTFTGNKNDDFELLEKLALAGCRNRYGQHHTKAFGRVKKELQVIRKQSFCAYFLITWDVCRYAESMGYRYVGRGSGANSIVAYCLKITDVDPLELDLYFERFINEFRSSPPDFDIDFSWDQRDEIQDYIFKRYGKAHTALLATYSTFKGRAIIRELGKVYGLPKPEIDQIVADPANMTKAHKIARQIFHYGEKIEGFPNHLSIHAGGIVISERPINYHTALQLMPKGFPITHFDMYHGEDLGFHKFDILSQRGLGHIKDAVDLVRHNQGKAVDIHDIPTIMKDKKVRAKLRSAQCVGCFYIESPAMRGLLSKLRCDHYTTLVAASSIIRPGVAQSGMMREYIYRYHNPYAFEYLHPVHKEHLGETFGVMVYQEDVMKIVHHFSGIPMDECDVLRRIMSGKRAKEDTFERLRAKFFKNCKEREYQEELTREVWRQVESFTGYSFCKAHSASYAVESFQSLYLKTYYPLEFMVAVINNFGGFYHTEYYFHEAKKLGGRIHAPCVNHSKLLTTLYDRDIYVGFIHIGNFERALAQRLVAERRQNGPYTGLNDFINRLPVSTEQLDLLIRINAFRFTGRNKYELMWEKNALCDPKAHYEATGYLFNDPNPENFELPILEEGEYDQAFDELELLGFPLCSPYRLLADRSKYTNLILARDLLNHRNRIINILGYFVCRKEVRTKHHKLMQFGTWLDEEGQYFDTTHFPRSLKQYPLRGKGIYLITGKVTMEFGFAQIEVRKLELLPLRRDERWEVK